MKKFIGSNKFKMSAVGFLVALLVIMNPLSIQADLPEKVSSLTIGHGQKVLTIGNRAYAAGTIDYNVDGTADDVQFTQAIGVLQSVGGGEIVALSGNYSWTAATTVNVPANITIKGVGTSTHFADNGVTPIFAATGANVTFRDFSIDAGYLTLLSDTQISYINGLTPTGRTSTYIIVSTNGTTKLEQSQADLIVNDVSDSRVQAAITTSAGRRVLLSGNFTKTSITGLSIPSNTIVEINGIIQLATDVGNSPFIFNCNGVDNIKIIGGTLDGNRGSHTSITGDAFNIAWVNVTNSEITGVKSINAGTTNQNGYNFYLNGSTGNRIHDNYASNARVRNYCIFNGSNNNAFHGNISKDSAADSFNIHSATRNTFIGNVSTNASNYDFDINDGQYNTYVGNKTEGAALHSFLVMGASSNEVIDGNIIITPVQAGVYIQDSSNISVTNNNIYKPVTGAGAFGGISNTNTTSDCLFSNNIISGSGSFGIIAHGNRTSVIGNKILTTANRGIFGQGSLNLYSGNTLYQTTTEAINIAGTSDVIIGNLISNLASGVAINNAGTGTVIKNNFGYNSENSSTFSISPGLWGVSVNHGLSTNATSVQITLTSNATAQVYVLPPITTTAFSVNLSALQGSTITGYWRAVVGAGN